MRTSGRDDLETDSMGGIRSLYSDDVFLETIENGIIVGIAAIETEVFISIENTIVIDICGVLGAECSTDERIVASCRDFIGSCTTALDGITSPLRYATNRIYLSI